jgi:hypothetical protein
LLLMGDRQSVGCAGAAIDFVAGREVQYSRAHLFDRASQGGVRNPGPFCVRLWRLLTADEVAAVFVRHSAETEDLIDRLGIQCGTVPLPAVGPQGDTTEAFNS